MISQFILIVVIASSALHVFVVKFYFCLFLPADVNDTDGVVVLIIVLILR